MKILVIHASAGTGHLKAAEAIEQGFRLSSDKNFQVQWANSLDYTSPFFKWLYEQMYLFMIMRTPRFWGLGYYLLDFPAMRPLTDMTRRVFNGINTMKLCQYLCEENFDCAISTHFLANEVISYLKWRKKIKTKLIAVITDLGAHCLWISPQVQMYVVGSGTTKEDLLNRGVPESKILVLGIPISLKFSAPKDPLQLRLQFGLKHGVFTLLLIGGGFGVGPIQEIVDELSPLPIQLIVICGKNASLYETIIGKSLNSSCLVKPLGYVDNIDEWMAVSDCVITKSGGLTVSEALASGLAMIIISPIPGQERKNCEVLVRAGAAVEVRSPSEVNHLVPEFMRQPDHLQRMRKRARELAHPDSAKNIAQWVLQKGASLG